MGKHIVNHDILPFCKGRIPVQPARHPTAGRLNRVGQGWDNYWDGPVTAVHIVGMQDRGDDNGS